MTIGLSARNDPSNEIDPLAIGTRERVCLGDCHTWTLSECKSMSCMVNNTQRVSSQMTAAPMVRGEGRGGRPTLKLHSRSRDEYTNH